MYNWIAKIMKEENFFYGFIIMYDFWRGMDANWIASSVRKGSDVNAQYENKVTPLHFLAWLRFEPELIKIFVDAGAKINAKDINDCTPLHYAVHFNGQEPRMISALLEGGADVNAEDKEGQTPLNRAKEGGCDHSVITLLEKAKIKNN